LPKATLDVPLRLLNLGSTGKGLEMEGKGKEGEEWWELEIVVG
jgi:hypothetical protein